MAESETTLTTAQFDTPSNESVFVTIAPLHNQLTSIRSRGKSTVVKQEAVVSAGIKQVERPVK